MKFSPETVNQISQWKETLTAMPTDQFLDYAKLFLGEIPTPFNKEKLVNQISAFFCQPENKSNTIALMGKNDIKIISLVKLLPEPTKESIVDFFSSEYDSFTIRSHLQNLEERMILYTKKSNQTAKRIYCINPILEEALGEKIGLENLIEKSESNSENIISPIFLSPLFLAAFISFILHRPDLCKGDGSVKKKPLKDFATICGLTDTLEFSNGINILVSSFRNLHLFTEADGNLLPDWQRLYNFARLPENQQYMYLCAGAFWTGHSHRNLSIYSQLLFDTILTMENFSYSREMILRLGTIIYNLSQDSEKTSSKFETLMSKVSNQEIDFSSSAKLEQLIDAALAIGIFVRTSSDAPDCFKVADFFFQINAKDSQQKFVSVESDFSVTIMPGLTLETLLPLIKFLDIKRLDVAAFFEINKQSMTRAFDLGMSLTSIQQLIENNSGFAVPQNLVVSLEDWFNTYSSATLYHGYILKLSESNVNLVEKNSVFAPHILEKLSPTILLLDFATDQEVSTAVTQSGLTFIGNIKTCSKEIKVPPLPMLKKYNISISNGSTYPAEKIPDVSVTEQILQSMKDSLEELVLTPEQKEGLLSRINRRIIVNKNQLQGATVHFDKNEATAMDNTGKIYIIDKAIQNEQIIEMTMDINALPQTGLPINLDKKNNTVTIKQKNGNEMTLPISAAVKVKKLPAEIQF